MTKQNRQFIMYHNQINLKMIEEATEKIENEGKC